MKKRAASAIVFIHLKTFFHRVINAFMHPPEIMPGT
jgi:hypothetical protein